MANIFFISDTHFGHANFLNFTNDEGQKIRPFSSVEEMDEFMVDQWNSAVKPHDHVWHLGDVALNKKAIATVGRCNGRKRLIRGNHDIFEMKDYAPFFEKFHGTYVIDKIVCTHIPINLECMGRYIANVHGHIHERDLGMPFVNVSVERTNYKPIALEDLKTRIDIYHGRLCKC